MNEAVNTPETPREQPKTAKRVRTNPAGKNRIYRIIGEVDRPLLIVVFALVCIGSIMIFSASYAYGEQFFHDSYYFARRQLEWVAIGLVAMALTAGLWIIAYLNDSLISAIPSRLCSTFS